MEGGDDVFGVVMGETLVGVQFGLNLSIVSAETWDSVVVVEELAGLLTSTCSILQSSLAPRLELVSEMPKLF